MFASVNSRKAAPVEQRELNPTIFGTVSFSANMTLKYSIHAIVSLVVTTLSGSLHAESAPILEPHLALPLKHPLSDSQRMCVYAIGNKKIRFCRGTHNNGEILEIFLHSSYRGENLTETIFIPIPDDRDQMLATSYRQLTVNCGLNLSLSEAEYVKLVGTPFQAVLHIPLKAMPIISETSLYWYGMSFMELLQYQSEQGGRGPEIKSTSDCGSPYIGL